MAARRKMVVHRRKVIERKNLKRSKKTSSKSNGSKHASDVADMTVKKRSRMDESEEKLKEKHLKMSMESMTSSGSELDSTVYEEKAEAALDTTKSMLQEGYYNNNNNKKVANPEMNVAFKVVNNNKTPKRTNQPMFKDLGGMSEVIGVLKSNVLFPLEHPECLRKLGIEPINGILFSGPPGCGKTMLAHAVANEARLPFLKISSTELISGVSGASEKNIRELFAKARQTAPSIVFIDEIDAIGSKRENQQRGMEIRIVTQLLTCMDESHEAVQAADSDSDVTTKSDRVVVIGATNMPDTLDSALRRPGRFDQEITLSVPDEKARLDILTVLITNRRIQGSFDLLKIARSTAGFVGADLAALVNKAGNVAMMRIINRLNCAEDWWKHPVSIEEMENLGITMTDFEEAAIMVQPSSRREGFSFIPNVKWEDVGGLSELRKDFDSYIIMPIKYPDIYNYAKVDLDFGFLLYGPPGCGKTLIAKAVANEAGTNFIHIKGPELVNKYVGESELAVRKIFSRARTCSPCILFFDEIDSLISNGETEGDGVVGRLLKQLMIELSGSDERRNVFLIGATNRPEVMDRALFRNERFGRLMHVTLPNADERGSILKALGRKRPVDPSMDLIAFGRDEACDNFSGADLRALMNEAIMAAVKETFEAENRDATFSFTIKKEHFKQVLEKISPSVSEEQKQHYSDFEKSLKACTQ